MSWNDQGGNGNQNDPTNINKNRNSPDLEQMLTKFIQKVTDSFKKSGGGAGGSDDGAHHYGFVILFVAVLVIWGLSGFYIVNPAERAVVLRFGQYVDVYPPGLHWVAPIIETKRLVDVQKIYSFSLDGDFLTKSSDQNDLPKQSQDVMPADATAAIYDQSKNLVNVELNVQYRVNNPRDYLFNVVSPNESVHQVAAGALSAVIGQMKLDDVLTTGREFLSSKVFESTKQVLSAYNSGIEIVAVKLRKAQAPDQVRAAFNDVNRADQDKATYIQQAQAYASKTIPIAQGMAARTLADAIGYQKKVVLTAQANIAKYQALLSVYTSSPEVTRERMYLETMQTILGRTSKILIDSGSNNLIYLPLDKMMSQSASPVKSSSGASPIRLPGFSQSNTRQTDSFGGSHANN